ncbi:hypothetical protein DY000_02005893 [Brassica cretica]|uniref:Uncharacterized protein n=1 Tax=Brassica cretica TaxID=69181 RepID=A0ABQ7BWA7_BRACR|nr:hypothetical protein DY000_02005893 [Brassica cretica]
MAAAIGAGTAMRLEPKPMALTESEDANFGFNARALSSGSTVFSTGFSEPCASSGTKKKHGFLGTMCFFRDQEEGLPKKTPSKIQKETENYWGAFH